MKVPEGVIPRLLVFVLLATTIVVLAVGAYPHHSLATDKSDLAAKVLGSPAFVVGMRIVAMYVFVFVLASVLARIWRGHWLRKAGPFEVSDEVEALKEARATLVDKARDAGQDIERLKDALADADMTIRTLSAQRGGLEPVSTGRGVLARLRGRVR